MTRHSVVQLPADLIGALESWAATHHVSVDVAVRELLQVGLRVTSADAQADLDRLDAILEQVRRRPLSGPPKATAHK